MVEILRDANRIDARVNLIRKDFFMDFIYAFCSLNRSWIKSILFEILPWVE